jgi:twitching motility protein PilT
MNDKPKLPSRPLTIGNTNPFQNSGITEEPVSNDYQDEYFDRTISDDDALHVNELLKIIVENKAADLHLSANAFPMMRLRGSIEPIVGYPRLTPEESKRIIYEMLTEDQIKVFEEHNELNASYSIPNIARFRVNVYKQRGYVSCAVRYIPDEILPLTSLSMPQVMDTFADFPRGLVLITGPTGSGKSTTLASIIDKINRNKKSHIITIEDPIEFVHQNKESLINQREIGNDTEGFKEALKNVLRQDPDVILLGEMRDLETISAALTAAETGHLVFATLHTQSVSETMSRIIDVFPEGAKNQVRNQLAATLQAIACQTLIKSADGKKMVPAVEILKANGAIRALIRKGHDEQIRTVMETNRGSGMQTLDAHLSELVQANEISVDAALAKTSTPDVLIESLGGEQGVAKIRSMQERMGGMIVNGR